MNKDLIVLGFVRNSICSPRTLQQIPCCLALAPLSERRGREWQRSSGPRHHRSPPMVIYRFHFPRPGLIEPNRRTGSRLAQAASIGLASISMAAQAMAEEAASTVADAVAEESSGLPLNLTVPEIVLLATPLVGYALFQAVIVPKVGGARRPCTSAWPRFSKGIHSFTALANSRP